MNFDPISVYRWWESKTKWKRALLFIVFLAASAAAVLWWMLRSHGGGGTAGEAASGFERIRMDELRASKEKERELEKQITEERAKREEIRNRARRREREAGETHGEIDRADSFDGVDDAVRRRLRGKKGPGGS